MKSSNARDIARYLETRFQAKILGLDGDFPIVRPVPLDQFEPNTVTFCNRVHLPSDIAMLPDGFLILGPDTACPPSLGPVAVTAQPRLAFGSVISAFFDYPASSGVHPSAQIDTSTVLGKDVCIEANVTIGANSQIGDHTRISAGVVIGPNVISGKSCVVLSNTVIGQAGFGVETAPDGRTLRVPHIGGVPIGDHVQLGSLNSVAAGTLAPTTTDAHVQTDNLVHIAHNVQVGEGTLITACAEISGSVTIGAGAWLGPNCSIMQKVSIGNYAMVGIGAVVTKSIPDNRIASGNSARVLRVRFPDKE